MSSLDGHKKIRVICILELDNRFLLIEQATENDTPSYHPVSGELKTFESPETAAIRVVKAITNIDVEKMKYWGTLVISSPTIRNEINFIYHVEIDWTAPIHREVGKLDWVDQIQLKKLNIPSIDWYIYQYILLKKPFAIHADYNQQLQLVSLIEQVENRDLLKK